jgi:hypothetical protein
VVWGAACTASNEARISDEGATATNGGTTNHAGDTPSVVAEYLELARRPRSERADADPQYVADGLRKLAGAVGTLNVGDVDLQVDLRVAAEQVLLNPDSAATTKVTRDRLIAAAEAIATRGPAQDDHLRQLAASLRPDRALVEQASIIRQFFQQSANALARLSAGGPGN